MIKWDNPHAAQCMHIRTAQHMLALSSTNTRKLLLWVSFGEVWGNSGRYVSLVMSFFATLCRKAHLWKSWLSQMSLGKYVNSSWSSALECKSYIKRISTLSFISYHECVLKSEFTIIHVNRIYLNTAEKSY